MSTPFKSWMHLKFYKGLTVLKAKMLGKIWVVAERHQDRHIVQRHPQSAVRWKSCGHSLQHTFQATTQRQTSGTLHSLLATRTERFCRHQCGCVPVNVTVACPLNQNTQCLQSTENELLHVWANAVANPTFTQLQHRLQQSILGAQSFNRVLWKQESCYFLKKCIVSQSNSFNLATITGFSPITNWACNRWSENPHKQCVMLSTPSRSKPVEVYRLGSESCPGVGLKRSCILQGCDIKPDPVCYCFGSLYICRVIQF